jgi:transcriptional regulator with XRE-family HTH domain
MARGTFDVQAFFAALESTRKEGGLTWKEVAGKTGVSASTLTRIAQGHRPDVDGLAALLSWSGLKAEDYIRLETQQEPATLARISTYLRADPKLDDTSARALEQIIEAAYQQMSREPEDGPSERVQERSARHRA